MAAKMIAIVGDFNGDREMLEKTLKASDTEVFVFNGQTGLFRAARGRRFDLAVVRVADGGARSLSLVEKIRTRNTAERIVGIFSEDVNAETGSKIADGLDEVIFEPFGYADFIGAVGAIIAPNELQEAAL